MQKNIKKTATNFILTVLGTFVTATGVGIFFVPFDLVTGGVSGLSIILKKAFSAFPAFQNVSIEAYVAVINWILFFMGLVFLGKAFAAKTLVSTVVYPVALSLALYISGGDFLGGFFNLLSDKYEAYREIAVVLAAVFGGATVGAGCALTYLGGGSTGGLDIPALILAKYLRSFKSSVCIFILDASVVVLGIFVIDNFIISLLGIVAALVCAVAIDKVFLGESGAFNAEIISDKYKEINRAVVNKLHRTTTVIDVVGGYSGAPKKMLMVTFLVRQYAELTSIVSAIDPKAFLVVHRAHQVGGEGWTYRAVPDGYLEEEEADVE